jgi:hypothetical protein
MNTIFRRVCPTASTRTGCTAKVTVAVITRFECLLDSCVVGHILICSVVRQSSTQILRHREVSLSQSCCDLIVSVPLLTLLLGVQGHVDMVTEKDSDSDHDFMKDPLRLHITHDGRWLKVGNRHPARPTQQTLWKTHSTPRLWTLEHDCCLQCSLQLRQHIELQGSATLCRCPWANVSCATVLAYFSPTVCDMPGGRGSKSY